MYRDLKYDPEQQAVVSMAGVVVVENVATQQEAFVLMNSTGELEKRLLAQQQVGTLFDEATKFAVEARPAE